MNIWDMKVKLATSRYLAVLRDANWLTRDLAVACTRVLLVVLVGFVAIIPWAAPTMNVGHDFAAFWTSAGFALDGRAGDAYGEPERAALAALLGPGRYPPLFYPPPALFLWLPFALVPFAKAAALWIATLWSRAHSLAFLYTSRNSPFSRHLSSYRPDDGEPLQPRRLPPLF